MSQSRSETDYQYHDAKARSSETNLCESVDNVRMNAEICRYRKALKDSGQAPPDPGSSSSTKPLVVDSTATGTTANDDHNSVESWRKRLKDVTEKNNQWQVYDKQREIYVQGLHQKYHELHCRYEQLNATYHRITCNPSMLAEEQRQYYDKLLIQARQEHEAYRKEIDRLKTEMESRRVEWMEEVKNSEIDAKQWKAMYEQELEKQTKEHNGISKKHGKVVNVDKENWDRVSSLQREMEVQRKDFSLERSKRESIERQLEILQKQLKCKEGSRKKTAEHRMPQVQTQQLSKSKSMKCSDKPPTPPPKLTKLSKEQKHTHQYDRRSHPIKLSHITVRKNKSYINHHKVDEGNDKLNQTYSEFGHHNDSNLECPNCGKIYPIDEHEFLLSHIDLCI